MHRITSANPDGTPGGTYQLGLHHARAASIVNATQMGGQPLALALGLAAAAMASLALTVLTSVRRRRRELALLKTLGMTRGQLRAIVAWQTTLTLLIALVGVPLGVAAGRWAWHGFAGSLGVAPGTVVPVLLLAAGCAAVLLAGNLLASVPAAMAARTPAAGCIALAGNGASLILLRQAQAESMNARGAFLEVASDTFGALAVLVTAAIIALTGWDLADPIASLAVGVLILPRTWRLLRDAVDVLLEASPRGIDLSEVRQHMTGLDGVIDVHDLHAWTITSGLPVLSAHVVVDPVTLASGCGPGLLDQLQECVRGHFDVAHSTFQIEPAGHADHEPSVHD